MPTERLTCIIETIVGILLIACGFSVASSTVNLLFRFIFIHNAVISNQNKYKLATGFNKCVRNDLIRAISGIFTTIFDLRYEGFNMEMVSQDCCLCEPQHT